MIDIETEIEPPDLPECDDEPTLGVCVTIREPDDTGRSAMSHLPADADDQAAADALVRTLIAAAHLRDPALAHAVRERMSREDRP